jgi:predicted permease
MKLAAMWRRMRFGSKRAELDEQLSAEMEQHIEMLAREFASKGMPEQEARRAARRKFGNPRALREASGEAWGFPSLESFAQDLRFGLRLLAHAPGFAVVAILTLAIGIGANTAVFSSVNALLLRQLPYSEPERLISIYQYIPTAGFLNLRERTRSAELAAFGFTGLNLTGRGEAARLNAAAVSANFFSVLKVSAWRGRTFEDGENSPGRYRVAVLSHALWQSRFGSDGNTIGRVVELDGSEYQVVGVMPPEFAFPNRETQVWVPLKASDPDLWGTWVQMIGRLRPGTTLEQSRAEIRTVMPQVVAKFPWPMPKDWAADADVIATQQGVVAKLRTKLLLLMGAVGLVLLIACANVANLLLTRAASRQREIAVRTALGAARGRIVRQLMTESIVLAMLGGMAGLALAPLGIRLVRTTIPENQLPVSGVSLDLHVLAFVAVAAMLTGILFGLAPAWRAHRIDIEQGLKAQGRTSMSRERRKLSASLVIAETALAMMLAVGAGLLVQSLWNLSHQETGMREEAVVTATLTPSATLCGANYGDLRVRSATRCSAFWDAVLDKVKSTFGVESAGYAGILPYRDVQNSVIAVENSSRYSATSPYQLMVYIVSPTYFRTMGIPLLAGRTFNEQDVPTAPGAVIVTRNVAQRLWPGENPIGKRVMPSWMREWRTVVGVVDEVRPFAMSPGNWADPSMGAIYYPHAQGIVGPPTQLTLVVRTINTASLVTALPGIVAQVNATVPVTHVQTMQQIIADSITTPRTTTWLFAALSGMALLLGAVGIYSLVSYSVSARTREIGIRMALGAERKQVVRQILREGMLLAGVGIAIGTAAAIGASRLLRTLLYGVKPGDPGTFALVAGVLAVVAMAAAYVPARRAASVDPASALRYE